MYIAIKSEIDSRPLVYPLIKALRSYGTVCVISSNKQICRLIDDDDEFGFRNVRVIYDAEGATDEVYNEYNITRDSYDFIILDNMGVIEYDVGIIPMGIRHSENFEYDIEDMLRNQSRSVLIQFGKENTGKKKSILPIGKASDESAVVSSAKRTKGSELPDDYDPAAKFRYDEESELQKALHSTITGITYPTMQQIEDLEADRIFYVPSEKLVSVIYDIVKDVINVDYIQFKKEVCKVDESSGYIKSRSSTGE